MAQIHDSRYSWIRLAISLVIGTTGNVGMWSMITVMPSVEADFGVGRAEVSLPFTATMTGFAIGSYIIGRIADRIGMAMALSISALAIGLGFSLAALAPNIMILTGIQFVIGFFTAVAFGPLLADISHWFLRRRGIAVSIAACGNYLAGVVWPVLLADLLVEEGWRAVYFWLAFLVVVVVLPLAQLLRRTVPEAATAHAEGAARQRAASTRFTPGMLTLLLVLAGFACCMAMAMPQVHIVSLCTDLGYGPAVGAEMLALMLLGGVASRIVSGFVADALGGVKALLIGSVLQTIGLILFLPFDGLTSLYIVSLVFGLSQGGIVPAYAIIVREYLPPKEAGARVGLVVMATIVGMGVGGWASGWIFDLTGSYSAAFLHGIGWNLFNIAIIAMILAQSRSGRLQPA